MRQPKIAKIRRVTEKAPKKRGRPATGKRSNPNYRQTLLWLRRDTLSATMKRLVTQEGKRFEMSDLIQALLERWLSSGGKLPKQ
jgi:hypothetical protein